MVKQFNNSIKGETNMRAFLAVDIPEEIRGGYTKEFRQLRDAGNMLFVKPDKMHITLAFFEDLREREIPIVQEIVERLTSDAILLTCEKPNMFSRRGIPSVVFVQTLSEQLDMLAQQIRDELRNNNVSYDNKPFKQHLTIARIKYLEDENMFRKRYDGICKYFRQQNFLAGSISLYSSNMVAYKKIFEIPLEMPVIEGGEDDEFIIEE